MFPFLWLRPRLVVGEFTSCFVNPAAYNIQLNERADTRLGALTNTFAQADREIIVLL